jgi:MoaA/NifB/PqqE/SkfB family radical SAM enzyme
MDQALFDTVLRKARDGGIDTLSLYSTGEPTLHPQFDEFVLHAKELGFLVICSTNGWMMSQRERGLRAVDSLQVSVEGWDKPTYERYRTPLTFERVYDGVAYYSTVRPADQLFSLNLMLTRSTDLEQFALLWANLFDEIRFHFMLPSGEFRDAQYHPVFAEELKDDYFAFTESPSKVCGDPFEVLNIGYDGAVLLCCNDFGATMGLGSINDDLASLYAHPTVDAARQQFRRQRIGMCKGCGQTLDVSHSVKAAVQAEVERVWTKWGITSRYSFAGDLETA